MKNLIVISAPSGAGKTTLCRALQQRDPGMKFSVSFTTRPKRPTEIDGVDYSFITVNEFKQKIAKGKFVEYENVHGNYYGTPKSPVEKAITNRELLLLEVDVRGAMSIKAMYPEHTMTIFLMPPSIEDLRTRLMHRGTDSKERIKKRLERLDLELGYKDKFDHKVINDKIDRATQELIQLIKQ